MAGEERDMYVKVRLSRDEYEALKAIARRRGYLTVGELLADTARRLLEGGDLGGLQVAAPGIDEKRLAETVAERLERRLVDLINPFTAKIDEVNRRVAEIIEIIEGAKERPSPPEHPGEQAAPARPRGRGYRQHAYEEEEETAAHAAHRRQPRGRGGRGGTALERLKTEGVLIASKAPWIKDPEKLFQYLEREGAVVLDLGEEKVAVDPELWERFQEVVEALDVQDSEEAAEIVEEKLGTPAGGELFKVLVKTGHLYYDEDRGGWTLTLPP